MKVSIELARHFGEVFSPEELNVDFKLEDEGTDTRVRNIVAHKHCPFCGNLENVYFMESVLLDDDVPFPLWLRTSHECGKCHVAWMVAARINKEVTK